MPRPARKLEEVLAGATRVFRRLGYERSSMDAVAREAGVSKATLYRYFPAKDALFLAVVEATPPARLAFPVLVGEPEEMLRRIGHGIIAAASDEAYLGLFRVAMGEGERFPEVGQALRERIFERIFPAVERLMAEWIATGRLRRLDPRLAAQQYIAMVMGYVLINHVVLAGSGWGISDAAVVEQAVTIFLHGAAPDRAIPDAAAQVERQRRQP